ncbi:MAG: nicotinamide-nucleotide amidase [Hyphomicrobiaceae bacterium]|jgi:nicotinamide-nucleotide amidase
MTTPFLKAALISTGDEVVGGRTIDTNSAWISKHLAELGVEVVATVVVGDYPERIAWAWNTLLSEADFVLCTGGLGPTADDLTNEVVASVAGVELLLEEAEADRIREIFAGRGRPMPANNLKQAMLPRGAVVIPNALGTAPGYRLQIARGDRLATAIVLPGVPREMKAMLADTVLPWVASHADPQARVSALAFQTFGLPESALDEALEGAFEDSEIRLAFRASFPRIAVRISTAGPSVEAEERLAAAAAVLRERLGRAVFAEGEIGMEEVVGNLLRANGLKLASAESCTGGLIGHRVTDVAGSSEYYAGGIVAYSNDLKEGLLGVRGETLARYGAVSEETAREMAEGACRVTGADLGVATTGIAGPGGGTDEKPVGTVAVALAAREGDGFVTESCVYQLWGSREWVKMLTSQLALDWVRCRLLGQPPLDASFSGGRRVASTAAEVG